MKKVLILFVFIPLMFGSCLKKDALDVEEFSNNNINDVAGVWYRYIVKQGEREVMEKVELDGFTTSIDESSRTIELKVTPSADKLNSIPSDALSELSRENVAVVVSLPTAARIFPKDGAPTLGINGDWSKPNKYEVVAANGEVAEWTIHMIELNK